MTRCWERARRAFDVVIGRAVLEGSGPVQEAIAIAKRRSPVPAVFFPRSPYANACSLRLDLNVLARTPTAVVWRDETTKEGEVTAQPLVGSPAAVPVRHEDIDSCRQEWAT